MYTVLTPANGIDVFSQIKVKRSAIILSVGNKYYTHIPVCEVRCCSLPATLRCGS